MATNRRHFLAGGLSLASTGLLPRSVLAQPSTQQPGGPTSASDQVVFAGFGGSLEQVFRNKIIPAFKKDTGITVTYEVGTALSNFAKLSASKAKPQFDIYWSNGLTHVAGKQSGLYAPLDKTVVKNLVDVTPVALDPDNIGVGRYIIATAFEYNTQAYAKAGLPKPSSWNDMWDPRLKGRVALLSFDVAATQDLLVILTKLAGGTEQDIRPGLEKIKSLKAIGNLTPFAASPAEIDNMISQQQAWLTVASSPRPLLLKQNGAPVDVAIPKEGAGFFLNYFEVVRNAPHPQAAQQFVNYLLGPEMQQVLAVDAFAAPVRRGVPLPKSLQGVMPSLDPAGHGFIQIDRVVMNRDLDKWQQMWNREILAS